MCCKKKNIAITLALLIGLFFACGIFFKTPSPHTTKSINIAQFHGTYLEKPRPLSNFHLTGVDKKSFSNAQLKGQWTLLFFGFTQCPSLCPTTMAQLNSLYKLLEAKKGIPLPHIVMITVDPKRDNTAKLGQYVHSFNPSFYGARGTNHTTASLTKELGIVYEKIALKNDKISHNYTIGHSGALMLINPRGEVNAFFTTPHNIQQLAQDYLLLVS